MTQHKTLEPMSNTEEKKYPIGGYAPGNYHCKCCVCGEQFTGDKRAVQCEPCAINSIKPTNMSKPKTPNYIGRGEHSVRDLENMCNQFKQKISELTQQNRQYVEALERVFELFKPSIDTPMEQEQEDLLNEIKSLIQKSEGK